MEYLLDTCCLKHIYLGNFKFLCLKNCGFLNLQNKELNNSEQEYFKNKITVYTNYKYFASLKVDEVLSSYSLSNHLCLVTLDKKLLKNHKKKGGIGLHYKKWTSLSTNYAV